MSRAPTDTITQSKVRRRTILKLPLLAAAGASVLEQGLVRAGEDLQPVLEPGLLRFGVMGDSGSGDEHQARVARQMRDWLPQSDWRFVLALGDNVYENGETEFFDSKFVDVYGGLLDRGVPIRSTLGNHDVRNRDGQQMVSTAAFGFVDAKDQYEFEAGPALANGQRLARFICLNSNRWIDAVERGEALHLDRLRGELRETLARSDKYRWNIAYFHHPIHSHVKKLLFFELGHGSSPELQQVLEPELRETVDLVLAGHDHYYQRMSPQHGVHHIVSGAAGKQRGGVKKDDPNVAFASNDRHFMDFALGEDEIRFQAINEEGQRIEADVLPKRRVRTLAEIARAA